ncbi:MAG: Signal transduction histidine-protein kinase/phosphatase DegS [Candidatus Marinimicrobia bacterium]|nr:Signal transduction histidine-protein kinase/phosphatase DegS [Candidatus Neomarinimicrobiota bacterium]
MVHKIFEDSEGHLWITANQAGVNRINPVTGKVTRFLHEPSDTNSISHDRVSDVFESHDGAIWLITKTAFNRLQQNTSSDHDGKWKVTSVVPKNEIYIEKPLHSIPLPVRNRVIPFGWNNGIQLYDPVGDAFYLAGITDEIELSGNVLMPSRGGGRQTHFWLFDEDKRLYKVYRDTLRIDKWELGAILNDAPFNTIREIRTDGPSGLWFLAHGYGLYHVETDPFSVTRYYDTGDNNRTLSGNICYAFGVDTENTIWVSTENGIQTMPMQSDLFTHITPVPGAKKNDANRINNIYQDRTGRIWLGGYLQMHWYYPQKDSIVPKIHRRIFPAPMKNNLVRTVFQDDFGRYWFGMMNESLWYADSSLNNFTAIRKNFGEQTLVRDIAQDSSGSLWFGVDFNRGKLLHLGLKELEPTIYQFNPNDSLSLSSSPITRVFIESRGRFWVGTWGGGLNLFDPVTGNARRFNRFSGGARSLSDNLVTDIQETTDGTIWIGTWNAGIDRVVENENTPEISFKNYSTAQGLPSNNIICLLPDKDNRLWIASGASVTVFLPDLEKSTMFSKQHGISNNEYFMGAREIDHTGRMYFGGTNGVTVFHPDSISPSEDSLDIYLTEFRIFNQLAALDTLIQFKKRYVLQHDENFVSIGFAAREFLRPGDIEYQYRLQGIDSKWIPAEGRQFVNFTHLPYGDYNFQVRARKHSSEWQGFQSVQLVVIPPFWLRPWFLVVGGILLLGVLITGIWLTSRYRLKRRIRRLEMQQKLQSEWERISRELHDHVGAKLTNIVTGLEIINLHTKKGKKESVLERINQLESHARSTINDLRQTIWSLKYDASSVSLLVEQIREFIHEQLQFREDLTIRCEYDEKENYQLSPLQALNLFRISQEAVMNAVKNANADKITIEVETTHDDLLRLCIRDDGDGFNVAEHKRSSEGFGLETMEQRAQKIQADIEIQSEMGAGTQVQVSLPFENKQDNR